MKKILLLFSSLAIVFIFIETYIKYFYTQNLSGSWRIVHESGLIMNKRQGESRHLWTEKNLQKKKMHVPPEVVYDVRYSFGKYHNRIYKDFSLEHQDEKILILGDSFTFGWLLNDNETFVYQLQKKFINKYFINVAVGGWGTADHLKYTELYCAKILPKEVWVILNNSDISRSINSNLYKINNEGKLIFLKPEINFKLKLKLFLNSFKLYQKLLENSHSIQLIRNFFVNIPNDDITYGKSGISMDDINFYAKSLFVELKKETKLCKADLKVFYLGWPEVKYDSKTKDFVNIASAENFFFKNNINFYNLTNSKYMANISKNLEYYKLKEGHPNKFANKIFFNSILNELK